MASLLADPMPVPRRAASLNAGANWGSYPMALPDGYPQHTTVFVSTSSNTVVPTRVRDSLGHEFIKLDDVPWQVDTGTFQRNTLWALLDAPAFPAGGVITVELPPGSSLSAIAVTVDGPVMLTARQHRTGLSTVPSVPTGPLAPVPQLVLAFAGNTYGEHFWASPAQGLGGAVYGNNNAFMGAGYATATDPAGLTVAMTASAVQWGMIAQGLAWVPPFAPVLAGSVSGAANAGPYTMTIVNGYWKGTTALAVTATSGGVRVATVHDSQGNHFAKLAEQPWSDGNNTLALWALQDAPALPPGGGITVVPAAAAIVSAIALTIDGPVTIGRAVQVRDDYQGADTFPSATTGPFDTVPQLIIVSGLNSNYGLAWPQPVTQLSGSGAVPGIGNLTAGYAIVTNPAGLTATMAGWSPRWAVILQPMTRTPLVNLAVLRMAVAGQPYRVALPASGGRQPLTWTTSPLPAGLVLDGDTITGTPAAPGVTTVTVTCTAADGEQATVTRRLRVDPPPAPRDASTPLRGYARSYDRAWTVPVPEVPPTPPPVVVPPPVPPSVSWHGLECSPGHLPDGLTTAIVETVDGWYDSPPLDGNNAERVLSDGSLAGPKTLGARVVVITGAVVGPRDQLTDWRDQLAFRAALREPVELVITDAGMPGGLSAMVRADTDSFRHTFLGGAAAFRWQVTLTCHDPLLYGRDWKEVTLRTSTADDSGRAYPRGRPGLAVPPAASYPWRYGSPDPPGSAAYLVNAGDVPAPVYAVWTGDLAASRLTDDTGSVLLAALAAGVQIGVDLSTLAAEAPGGAQRPEWVLPGSVPLLIPARSTARWHLYSQGSGTVLLAWRDTWA
jgi:hypothetical protein